MFPEKHVRVFPETRTCFSKNSYVFFLKVVRVSKNSRTCFLEDEVEKNINIQKNTLPPLVKPTHHTSAHSHAPEHSQSPNPE